MHLNNRLSNYMRRNLIEWQGEIDEVTIIVKLLTHGTYKYKSQMHFAKGEKPNSRLPTM